MSTLVRNPDFGSGNKYYYKEGTRKIYVENQNEWNQSGEGGGNALIYMDEPTTTPAPAPAPRAAPVSRGYSKPKAEEPAKEEEPAKAVDPVSQGEVDQITPPAEGLEDTIITSPETSPVEAPPNYFGYQPQRMGQTFLTKKKKDEETGRTFLTRS